MVMMRNNSRRAVSSKQSPMADKKSFSSPIQSNTNNNNPISSFLASPRFFNGLLTRSLSDIVESEISPKSILDSKKMFNLGNPFGYDRNSTNSITYMDKKHSTLEGIKLALLDPIENEEKKNTTCRMVLFGTELKDFGIKTKDSQVLVFGNVKEEEEEKDSSLSLKEMESSEDYTCVITHGPNPKTTHIFDNCVVQSYSVLSESKKENQCSC